MWKIILDDKIGIVPYYPIVSHDKCWDVFFHVYFLFRKKLVAGRHRLGVVSGQSLQYAPALLGGRREERGRQGRHVTPFRDPLPSGKLT